MGNVIQPMWADCPALTRTLCVGYPALSLAMMVLGGVPVGDVGLDTFLFDTSLLSISRMHLWALFVGCFYSPILSGGMQFLMSIFTIFLMLQQFPRRERQTGSTAHLLWIMSVNCVVNVLRLVIVYLLGNWLSRSTGMWPILIADLTIYLLADPEGQTSFWGLVSVPNKWYPVALVAFFCVLSGMQPLWDMITAAAFGYAYSHWSLERYMPSPALGAKLERLSCCRQGRFSLLGASWVPASSTPNFGNDASDRRYDGLSDFGRTSGQQLTEGGGSSGGGAGGGGAFTVFAGAGNTLGGGSGGAAPLQPADRPLVQSSPPPREEGPNGVAAEPGDGV